MPASISEIIHDLGLTRGLATVEGLRNTLYQLKSVNCYKNNANRSYVSLRSNICNNHFLVNTNTNRYNYYQPIPNTYIR